MLQLPYVLKSRTTHLAGGILPFVIESYPMKKKIRVKNNAIEAKDVKIKNLSHSKLGAYLNSLTVALCNIFYRSIFAAMRIFLVKNDVTNIFIMITIIRQNKVFQIYSCGTIFK